MGVLGRRKTSSRVVEFGDLKILITNTKKQKNQVERSQEFN